MKNALARVSENAFLSTNQRFTNKKMHRNAFKI